MTEDDKLSFLDQPRDETGRFASKQDSQPVAEAPPPAPEPPAETQPALTPEPAPSQPASAPVQPPPGYIPMAAVLDEREKRQKYERELEDMRRKYEEATRKPPQPLDPIADPEAFERSLNERIQQSRWDAITSTSLVSALRTHGREKVTAAEQWVEQQTAANPAFRQTILNQLDPYDFVVQEHQKSLRQQKLGDKDPDEYAIENIRELAKRPEFLKALQDAGLIPAAAPGVSGGVAPSPHPTLPRPSLASAPSAGGKTSTVPVGPGEAFNAVFK